jgi:uncharacterized protein involved in exopolysaccharide biosynthesis
MLDMKDETLHPLTRPHAADLVEMVRTIWRRRWVVLVTTILTVTAMIAYLNVAPYRYTATVKLTGAQSGSGGLASQLGSLGGLASLANVRLPQGPGEQGFLVFSQDLVSRTAAEVLLRHPDIVHVAFAREWDARRRTWVEPTSGVRPFFNAVKRAIGLPVYAYVPPNAARMQAYLEERVGVAEDTRKPIVSLSYAHEDPAFARRFLRMLIDGVDEDLRRRALARARANITYLSEQLKIVQLTESRTALAATLGEQEKARMAASSGAPFAGDALSDVSVTDRPTSPKPIPFLIGSLVLGIVLGGLLALVIEGLRRKTATVIAIEL